MLPVQAAGRFLLTQLFLVAPVASQARAPPLGVLHLLDA